MTDLDIGIPTALTGGFGERRLHACDRAQRRFCCSALPAGPARARAGLLHLPAPARECRGSAAAANGHSSPRKPPLLQRGRSRHRHLLLARTRPASWLRQQPLSLQPIPPRISRPSSDPADPFADEAAAGPAPEKKSSKASKADSFAVHVRMQQRNGRKSLTTVQVRLGATAGTQVVVLAFPANSCRAGSPLQAPVRLGAPLPPALA